MNSKEITRMNGAAEFMKDLAAAIEKAVKAGLDAGQITSLMEQMKEIVESE